MRCVILTGGCSEKVSLHPLSKGGCTGSHHRAAGSESPTAVNDSWCRRQREYLIRSFMIVCFLLNLTSLKTFISQKRHSL